VLQLVFLPINFELFFESLGVKKLGDYCKIKNEKNKRENKK